MVRLIVILQVIFFNLFANCIAQHRELNSDFIFNDGIYLSIEDFLSNRPTYRSEYIHIEFMEDGYSDFNMKKVNQIIILGKNDTLTYLNHNKIWGFCIEGKPYINNTNYQNKANSSTKGGYTRVRIVGSLCFFMITSKEKSNGFDTGLGFGLIGGTVSIPNQKIADGISILINMRKGIASELTLESLIESISDDELLLELVQQDNKADKKLLHYVLKYNERNIHHIPD